MNYLEQLSGLSWPMKLLCWGGMMIAGALLSRLALEIDWKFISRSYLPLFFATSLIFLIISQVFVWNCMPTATWIKIITSVGSAAVSVLIWFIVMWIGTWGGMRSVPAG